MTTEINRIYTVVKIIRDNGTTQISRNVSTVSQVNRVGVGPQGPPGVGGSGDKNFVYTQASSSSSWNIAHNLSKYPAVTVIDSAGTEVHGTVVHVDKNNCIASFGMPFSGTAVCN